MGMLVIVGWLGFSFDLSLGLGFLNFGKNSSHSVLDWTWTVHSFLEIFSRLLHCFVCVRLWHRIAMAQAWMTINLH